MKVIILHLSFSKTLKELYKAFGDIKDLYSVHRWETYFPATSPRLKRTNKESPPPPPNYIIFFPMLRKRNISIFKRISFLFIRLQDSQLCHNHPLQVIQTVTASMYRTLDVSKDIHIIRETRQLHVFKTTSVSCGVESSCIHRITAPKSSCAGKGGSRAVSRWATVSRTQAAVHSLPSGHDAVKTTKMTCLFPMRTDASGHRWPFLATLRHKHFGGQKSKQALSLPTSLLPLGSHGPADQRLCSALWQETDQDCQGLSPTTVLHTPSLGDPHSYRSTSQTHTGIHPVAFSSCRKPLLFFAPGNLEGTGLLLHHSNWANADRQILDRKQPKEPQELNPGVANSRYHLPLDAITAANDFAFCWQDESLREAKQKEKYFTK